VKRLGAVAAVICGLFVLSTGLVLAEARASAQAAATTPKAATTPPAADTPPPPTPDPTPTPAATPTPSHPSFDPLGSAVEKIVATSGAGIAVALIELGGPDPEAWSLAGSQQFEAASTYKLPLLMWMAQLVAAGQLDVAGEVCYLDSDWEDGWFTDYTTGDCFTRQELAARVGLYSDNTAAHMLVRDLGGSDSLNAFARAYGATGSMFYDVNTTTAADLAALWEAEVRGEIGGSAAQAWLYPLLSHTKFETGVSAGVPSSVTVVHKTGEVDGVVHDAALVTSGPGGPYILVVMTDNLGGNAAFKAVAEVSAAVWQYETSR